MSEWRRRALATLPELKSSIEAVPSVMSLWIELHFALERAYSEQPPDQDLIKRLYGLAIATLTSNDADATTAVVVAFFEHLPTHPAVRSDLHRWLQPDLFAKLEGPFKYFLSASQFEEFRAEYHANLRRRQRMPLKSRRRLTTK